MAERMFTIPPMLSSLSSSAAFLRIAQAAAAAATSRVKDVTPAGGIPPSGSRLSF